MSHANRLWIGILLIPLLWPAGCTHLVGRATQGLADDLAAAILDQDDPATVRDGAPAFLLMVDGMIQGAPDDDGILLAGAKLYGAYVGAFVEDPDRARRLSARAFDYARRAVARRRPDLDAALEGSFEHFEPALAELGHADLDLLYGLAAAWAGWVQARSGDWNAIAELPKIEAAMARVVELDDAYQQGAPHLYLAVLKTQLSPNLGGKPELGRHHFERAIALSAERNLTAKVLFAERYARLVFDRELHDRLLGEVLESDPRAEGLTLGNVLAQDRARALLDESDDYF